MSNMVDKKFQWRKSRFRQNSLGRRGGGAGGFIVASFLAVGATAELFFSHRVYVIEKVTQVVILSEVKDPCPFGNRDRDSSVVPPSE